MATFRRGRENNFTVVGNQVLKDDKLSWKAKGIISYIMSLPDDWEIHTKELVKHATDGRDSLMSGIKELKKYNYVIYNKYQDEETGKFIHEYDVYDKPQTENPGVENPAMDNPTLENPSLLQKTNELSTNKQNTNSTNSSSTLGSSNSYPTLSKLERTDGGHRKYPKEFEDLWELYPNRQGSANKGGAYEKFRARIKEGITYKKLFEGVKTYFVEQKNKDNINTPYVMQMKKFFGAKDIWLEYAEKDLTKEGGNDKVRGNNGGKKKTTEEQKEEWRKDFANFSS